ncbi:chitin synthase regulatory factor chr2 [Pelomyxa schiedti]|nr:chitin synthase regulatory factor chr2 [Pelomyxa schiedti]
MGNTTPDAPRPRLSKEALDALVTHYISLDKIEKAAQQYEDSRDGSGLINNDSARVLARHYKSKKTQKGVDMAQELYEGAHDGPAMFKVAMRHKYGDGGAKCDMNKCERLLEKAVEIGRVGATTPRWCGKAMVELGTCYRKGLGVERNPKTAVSLYRRALPLPEAEVVLAVCYLMGEGVPCNPEEAVQQLKAGVERGGPAARMFKGLLGLCLLWGLGVESNVVEGIGLILKGDEEGDGRATVYLGHCIEVGCSLEISTLSKRVRPTTYDLYCAAVGNTRKRRGGLEAFCELGKFLRKEPCVATDKKWAVALFQHGADAGDPDATYHLGMCTLSGEGVDRNRPKATQLLENATAMGHKDAFKVIDTLDQQAKAYSSTSHLETFIHAESLQATEVLNAQQPETNHIQEGHLERIAELGKGAYGTVSKYIYRNPATNVSEDVAVKALHKEIKSTFNEGKFQTEAETMSRLRHPNIVKFIGTCRTSTGQLWIISELMELSIRDILQTGKSFNFREVIALSSGIAKGMTALHGEGIMHRDLNSGNILLDSCGTPKIADFGMSKALQGSCGHPSLHPTLTKVAGTPIYLPPQMYTCHYNIEGDMWEFAVLLSELLTGIPEDTVPTANTSQIQEFIRIQKASLLPLEIAEVERLCSEADIPVAGCLCRRSGIIGALRNEPKFNNVQPACVRQFSLIVESCLSILESNRPSFIFIEQMLRVCALMVFTDSPIETPSQPPACSTLRPDNDATTHTTACSADISSSPCTHTTPTTPKEVDTHIAECLAHIASSFPNHE